MTSRNIWFALLGAVICCLLLGACNKKEEEKEEGVKAVQARKILIAAHTITFTVATDGSGNCWQALDANAPGLGAVEIPWGDSVTFTAKDGGGNKLPFTVSFPPAASASCDSPFQRGCQSNFSNATVSGASSGGAYFPYQSITINGQACGSPGSLGFIMKP